MDSSAQTRDSKVVFETVDDVPVIDVSALVAPSATESDRKQVVDKINAALRHLAFFQIINHGVPLDLIERTNKVMVEFFAQPQEVKDAVHRTPKNARG